jgi:hypothetical protein
MKFRENIALALLVVFIIKTSYSFSSFGSQKKTKVGKVKRTTQRSLTSVFTKGAAFHQVRSAAQKFKSSEGLQQAAAIVNRLEVTPSEKWGASQELPLIDCCLVDEEQEACDDFQDAMMTLREMYEPAAGNA